MEKKLIEILERERLKRKKSVPEMAIIIGITERMYDNYLKGEFKGTEKKLNKFLSKLSESDLKTSETKTKSSGPSPELEKKILQSIQDSYDEMKLFRDHLLAENKMYHRIIGKALDDGAITVDGKKIDLSEIVRK